MTSWGDFATTAGLGLATSETIQQPANNGWVARVGYYEKWLFEMTTSSRVRSPLKQ